MYKLFFSIGFVLISFSLFAQNTGNKETETYFLTFNIKYGYQKSEHIQDLFMDIGTMKEHPFYGKMKNIDNEKISLGNLSNVQIFLNEVDLLYYLTVNGWEIVTVQNVKELATNFKQYLMKLEK